MSFQLNPPRRMSLDDLINQQNQERGLEPLALEPELLLKRVADGGHSGQFLANALSALTELIRLFCIAWAKSTNWILKALGCFIKSYISGIFQVGMTEPFIKSNNK